MVQQAFLNLTKDNILAFIDSLDSALYDWAVIGMVSCVRRFEWCQDRSFSVRTSNITRNFDGSASAFIPSYSTFELTGGVRMENSRSLQISDASVLKIK